MTWKGAAKVGAALTMALLLSYFGVAYGVVAASLVPAKPQCPYRVPAGPSLTVEPLALTTSDGLTLAAWLLPAPSDRAVVLVHGLGSFGWERGAPDVAKALLAAGINVLVFDLRGNGQSEGDRLGLGWHERRDLRAAVDLLLARGFEPAKIGLYGASYGAATALLSAAVIPEIGAVVSDSAFADARDVMDREIERSTGVPVRVVRFLRPGLSIVAAVVYDLDLARITPERAVAEIAPRPILFIHGADDHVIPVQHVRRLMEASGGASNELWIIPGHDHTEGIRLLGPGCDPPASSTRETYLERVTTFFQRWLR